jgi:predicted RNase H-like nuclease (RuvC/YqgF family)
MSDEQTLISGIEYKVRKLVEINSELKEENIKLHQNIDNLEEKLRLLSVDLNKKQNELFNISLANTLEKEFGVEESKKKIDSLLKEIDRCIEVLSE